MPVLVEPTFTEEHTMSVSEAPAAGKRISISLGRGHGLGHECGIAADQVDADLLGSTVERVRDLDESPRGRLAGACADQRDRSDGDALVDDRDAVVAFDGLAGGYESLAYVVILL